MRGVALFDVAYMVLQGGTVRGGGSKKKEKKEISFCFS